MAIFIRRVVEKTCFSLPPGPASLSESESGSSPDGNCKQLNNKSLSQNEVTGGGGGTIFLGNVPTVVTYILVLCSGRHFLHSIPRTTINLRKVPRARKWTTKDHFLASHHEETGVAEHSVEEKSKFRIFFFLPGEQLARGEVHRPAWIPEVSNFEFCPKRLLWFNELLSKVALDHHSFGDNHISLFPLQEHHQRILRKLHESAFQKQLEIC